MSLDEAAAAAEAAAAPPVIRPDYVSRPTNYNRVPARAPRVRAPTSSTASTSTVVLPPIGTIFVSTAGTSASSSSSTAPQRQTSSSYAAFATPTVPVQGSTMMKTPALLASAGVQPTTFRVVHGLQSPVSMQPVSPAETLGTLRATASTTTATATTAAAPTGASARSKTSSRSPSQMILFLSFEFNFSATNLKTYGRGKDFVSFHSFSVYARRIDFRFS